MRIPASFLLLLIAVISTAGVAGTEDIVQLCPTDGGSKRAEARCLRALDSAKTSKDSQLEAQLLEGLAVIYQQQGRTVDAMTALQRSVALSADPLNPAMRLSEILENSGRLRDAAVVWQAVIKRYSSSSYHDRWARGYAELHLGDILLRLNEPKQAEREYRRSIGALSGARHPGGIEDPARRLIHLYASQGRSDAAMNVCEEWKRSTGIAKTAADKTCAALIEGLIHKYESGHQGTAPGRRGELLSRRPILHSRTAAFIAPGDK